MSYRAPSPNRLLDMAWVRKEVIPLLVAAYQTHPRYSSLSVKQWEDTVATDSHNVDTLPVYEDFASTIERVRLMLINPSMMTSAEMDDYSWIRDEPDTCITIFVRHAIRHGTFKLHSLGTNPDPDHPRRKVHDDTYIYGGKFAARKPKSGGYQRPPLVPNLRGGGHLNSFRGRSRGNNRGGSRGRGAYKGGFQGRQQWPDQRQEQFGGTPQGGDGRFGGMSPPGQSMQPPFGAGGMAVGGRGNPSYSYGGYQQPPSQGPPVGAYPQYPGNFVSAPVQHGMASANIQYGMPYPPQGQYPPSRFGTDGVDEEPFGSESFSQDTSDDRELPGGAVEFQPGRWVHGA